MRRQTNKTVEALQAAKEIKTEMNEYTIRLYANDDVYLEKVQASRVNVTEGAIILYDRGEKIVGIFPIACSALTRS